MWYSLNLQVKAHPFFKYINWDTLARQKVSYLDIYHLLILVGFDMQESTLRVTLYCLYKVQS